MSGLPTSGDTQRRAAGGEVRSRRRAAGLVLRAMLRASLAICDRAATSIAPSADGVGVAFGVTWGEQTGDAVGEATAPARRNDDRRAAIGGAGGGFGHSGAKHEYRVVSCTLALENGTYPSEHVAASECEQSVIPMLASHA